MVLGQSYTCTVDSFLNTAPTVVQFLATNINKNKKDGYRQRNVRQFLQSA